MLSKFATDLLMRAVFFDQKEVRPLPTQTWHVILSCLRRTLAFESVFTIVERFSSHSAGQRLGLQGGAGQAGGLRGLGRSAPHSRRPRQGASLLIVFQVHGVLLSWRGPRTGRSCGAPVAPSPAELAKLVGNHGSTNATPPMCSEASIVISSLS